MSFLIVSNSHLKISELAITSFKKTVFLIKNNPKEIIYFRSYMNLIFCLIINQRFTEAIFYLNEIKTNNKEQEILVKNYKLQCFLFLGNLKLALDLCTQIAKEENEIKCSFYDNETIEHHDKYLGSRKKRGLYITAEKKQVNADVNGSLNIMKRYALEIQKQNEGALIKDDALIGEVESIRTTNIIIPVKVHLEIKKGNKISKRVK